MSGARKSRRLLMPIALIVLAGCSSKDGPPTDDETFAAFMQCWNANAQSFSLLSAAPYSTYLQPVGAHLASNGITQESPFGKEYSVTITFSYRALRDVLYRCNPDEAFSISIWPVTTTLTGPAAFRARPGGVLSCNSDHSFSKVAEGWIFHVNPALSYVIRR